MKRAEILLSATDLIDGDRARDYGDANASFARIGAIWGALLDRPALTAAQVASMMVGLKLVRASVTPDHLDSWIDAAGYIALGAEAATQPAVVAECTDHHVALPCSVCESEATDR